MYLNKYISQKKSSDSLGVFWTPDVHQFGLHYEGGVCREIPRQNFLNYAAPYLEIDICVYVYI